MINHGPPKCKRFKQGLLNQTVATLLLITISMSMLTLICLKCILFHADGNVVDGNMSKLIPKSTVSSIIRTEWTLSVLHRLENVELQALNVTHTTVRQEVPHLAHIIEDRVIQLTAVSSVKAGKCSSNLLLHNLPAHFGKPPV